MVEIMFHKAIDHTLPLGIYYTHHPKVSDMMINGESLIKELRKSIVNESDNIEMQKVISIIEKLQNMAYQDFIKFQV